MKVKVLIIRFSSIGDIMLTTPLLRCLSKQLEGKVQIHYLTKQRYSPLLSVNPYIDKLYCFEKGLGEVLSDLHNEGYDYIIDLHKNIRSARVKRFLGALAFSVNKINWQKWLMVHFKINRLPDMHLVERYFETLQALSVTYDGQGLDCFIPEDEEMDMHVISESFKDIFVAFAIGGAHETKKMPVAKMIDLCKRLNKPVILLGGEEDRETGRKISAACGQQNIHNACGELSLMQSASVIKQAGLVITHDTGMMHIAAAFGKEIISIWGNTIPAFGMTPFMRQGEGQYSIFQVDNLRCRPCSKLGYPKCPKTHFSCMQLQDTDAIAEAVNTRLSV